MKKLLILAVGILSLPSFASVSANVSFTSDYIWRGMTQSDAPAIQGGFDYCLLYTSPSPRDGLLSRMPSSA